jgi:hypothetical protein
MNKKCDDTKFKIEYNEKRLTSDERISMFTGSFSFKDFEKKFCESQAQIRNKISYGQNSFYSGLDSNK